MHKITLALAATLFGSSLSLHAVLLATDTLTSDSSGAYLYNYSNAVDPDSTSIYLTLDKGSGPGVDSTKEAGWNYGATAPTTEIYSGSGDQYIDHIKSTPQTIQISDLEVVDGYYVFYLDGNESDSQIDLVTFDIYVNPDSTGGDISFNDISSTSPNYTADNPDFSLVGDYEATQAGGTQSYDLAVLVPVSDLGTTSTDYVTLYTEFHNVGGGNEEWGFAHDDPDGNGLPDLIPEPSSSALMLMAGGLMLARRRR